jgi:diacylglycerol kinase family enzyme
MRADHPSPVARERVAVVMNGNAKQVTEELLGALHQIVEAGDLFVSRSLEEGEEIAQRIVEQGYPTVLSGGGDGTFAQVVTWIVDRCEAEGRPLPRFGLLKLGTGNGLAWVLGAQEGKVRGVFADLARLRDEGGHGWIRMLRVEGRLAPFAGIGVDGIAIRDYNRVKNGMAPFPVIGRWGAGGLGYVISMGALTLPRVVVTPRARVRIVNIGGPAHRLGDEGQPVGGAIAAGDVLYEGPTRSVLVSTVPYWGWGSRIFPFADPHGDRFSVRVVNINSQDVVKHLPAIWRGTYRDPRLIDFLADGVRVEYDQPMPAEIAGDPSEPRASTEVVMHPARIPVVDYYAPPPLEEPAERPEAAG